MSGFNFLRESEVHIVYGSNRYNVKVTPELSFNQTFAEDAYSVKTLHNQSKMFEGATITKANPAVVTANSHGLSDGDRVFIKSVAGMTEVNNFEFTVANKTTNT